MEERLKVGDIVRVTGDTQGMFHQFEAGTVGAIVDELAGTIFLVTSAPYNRWVHKKDLERLQPPQFAQAQPALVETLDEHDEYEDDDFPEDDEPEASTHITSEAFDSYGNSATITRFLDERDDAHLRPAMWPNASSLPAEPAQRKAVPITTGVLDYFPAALAEVARVSKAGNEQHHPGQPLHWERGKSTDHADTITRHLMDRGTLDTDGQRHSAKVAWRALAMLQEELEAEGYPQARGSR